MAHVCNPSYFGGGRDQEGCGSRPAWAISLQHLISTNKVGMGCLPVIPAMGEAYIGGLHSRPAKEGSTNRRMVVQIGTGINVRSY
jgi:hypothetical protein